MVFWPVWRKPADVFGAAGPQRELPEEVLPMRRLLVIMLVLLAGCGRDYLAKDDPDYPYYLPPVGSSLALKRQLTVPGGETRIFLQGGEMMKKSRFDRYRPSCSFELRKLAETPRTIEPDSFIVTRIERLIQEIVQRGEPAPGLFRSGLDDDSSPPFVVRGYHLWLGSERQPDVMRMTCRGAFADMHEAYPPTLNEVKRSLGDYAELILRI